MKEKVRIGVVGLGNRGHDLLKQVLLPMCEDDVEISALCDTYGDRIDRARKLVAEAGQTEPFATDHFEEMLKLDLDAVMIFSAWETHIPFACAAMRAGKYVGLEVGGAYSIEDCWKLVRTYEETGVPCMLLENCCYGRRELMILNMVRQGVFGEIVHCEGGYRHDLREEVSYGAENRHYRLRNYLNRNCENYPTHELGPIAKLMNVNRGNRMVALNSIASCAKGLHTYILDRKGADDPLADAVFQQGDVVTTVIRLAGGQTITMTLDTTLPRPYSRQFTVQGTKGMYSEDNDSIFLDHEHNAFDFTWKSQWGNATKYEEAYLHPLWKNYVVRGTHDGMDWILFRAFFESVKLGAPVPIDVYDAASWMSITALSEQSIAAGGAAVAIPDFTSGRWTEREAAPDLKYWI